MSVFALPALVALLTKIWVCQLAKQSIETSKTVLWLLVFFALNNLSEVLVISKLFNHEASEYLLRSYYVTALFSLAYMCIFTMSVAKKNGRKPLEILILSIALVMSLLIFQTNWIVAGAISLSYTATVLKGTYYAVFQLTALCTFVWISYSLIRRYLCTTDAHTQLRCFYALFALSPIIITSIIVIIMMELGYQYTGAILLPFSSTFFLLLIVITERNTDIIRMRHRLPFSAQRKSENEILSIYRSHVEGDLDLPETKNKIERVLIRSALARSDNNVTLTAAKLGIQRSTLYSIFNRLDMKRKIPD